MRGQRDVLPYIGCVLKMVTSSLQHLPQSVCVLVLGDLLVIRFGQEIRQYVDFIRSELV